MTFVSNIATLAVGLLVNVLIARSLGPSAKGLYAVFLNTQGLLLVPMFAVEVSLFYVVARRRPDRASLGRFAWRTAVAQSFLSVGVLAVLVQIPALRRLLFPGLENIFLLVLMVALAFSFWERYRAALLPGNQLYGRFAVVAALTTIVGSVCIASVLTVFWFVHRPVTVGVVILAATGGIVVSAAIWQQVTSRVALPDAEPATPATIAREVRAVSISIFARTLVEWVSYRIDVYLVNALAGSSALGLYTVAIGGGQQLLVLPFALANPLFTRIARDGDTSESRDTTRYAFKLTGLVSIGLAVIAAAAAPILIPLLYGHAFAGSVLPLLIFLPGVVAVGATRVFNSYFSGCNRNIETVKAEMVAVVITVSLDGLLIPRFGTSGAAVAASSAYISSSAVLTHRFVALSSSSWVHLFHFTPHDRLRFSRAWTGFTHRLPRVRWGHP
jgi:O-antigen/teichoic acid export membrane protein